MFRKCFLIFVIILSSSVLHSSENAESDSTLSKDHSFVKKVELWYDDNMNYPSITLLMALESSVFPVPSELVISPAAYAAADPQSRLKLIWIIIFSTLGSLIGSLINYSLSSWIGRPALYKFADSRLGRFFFLSSQRLQQAEAWFEKYSKISICTGRLIPGIRHLISIPAGLSRMNIITFSVYTFVGSGIWNTLLALFGYFLHGQAALLEKYGFKFMIVLVLILIFAASFLKIRSIRKNKQYR